jgi:formate-dependent nitrite reductase membrane component NrfD
MIGPQSIWEWEPALDLFAGGLASGAFLITAILYLLGNGRFKTTIKLGGWTGAAGIGLGLLALLIEVGKPFRAMMVWRSFVNLDSWLAIGAWILLGSLIVFGLFAIFSTWGPFKDRKSLPRTVLAIIGIPLCAGIVLYTSMLLSTLDFIPFWNTWFLSALFPISALLTGVAIVLALALVWDKDAAVVRLKTYLQISILVLIVAQGIVLWFYFNSMLGGSEGAMAAANMVTNGELSLLFWVLAIGLGLGVPFIISILSMVRKGSYAPMPVQLAGILLLLVGGFTLRYVVLLAGIHEPLVAPSIEAILNGVTFIP